MKMYVLDDGKIEMKSNRTEGLSNDAIPIHSFLFDTEAGYVLFDTACDPDGMTGAWPVSMCANPYVAGEKGHVHERLAELGIRPEEIRYVVMSHLHMDHAGCLKFFKNAEVFVNRQEFVKTMTDYVKDQLNGFHVKSDIENWLRAGIRWNFIFENEKRRQISPGLTILNFGPGHSYGMLGLLAELDSGKKYLLAADAIYSRETVGPPVKAPGICYDEPKFIETVEKIIRFAKQNDAEVLYGHDMAQFRTLIKSTEGCYE